MAKTIRKMDSETVPDNIVYQSSGIQPQESLISLYIQHKEMSTKRSLKKRLYQDHEPPCSVGIKDQYKRALIVAEKKIGEPSN